MKNLNPKTTAQPDLVKTIELEKYAVTLENGHDVIAQLAQKHRAVYETYRNHLGVLYHIIEDEFLADQVFAMSFQFIVNLTKLELEYKYILGAFLELDDNFFSPNQETFLATPEGIPLLNSILKHTLDLFVLNEYDDLPTIYHKLGLKIKNYLEENGVLPKDLETLIPIYPRKEFN